VKTVQALFKSVSVKLILMGKEGRELSVCDKSQGSKCAYPIPKIQDFMIKIYLKDAYFTIPLGANFKKFVRFRGGESIRIPMPDVWSRSNLKDLHKIVEDIDFSVEKVAHKT